MFRKLVRRLAPHRPALTWAAFGALYVAVMLFQSWLEWPLAKPPRFPLGWLTLAVMGLCWLLSQDQAERIAGRLNPDGPGVWRTGRPERLRRLTLVLFMVGLLPVLGQIAWAHWLGGDLARLIGAVLASLALSAGIVHNIVQIWRARVELRIDAAGVFAPAWRAPIPWDAIAFAVQPRGGRDLRLMLKEDGLRTLSLTPSGLHPDEALAALRAVRPDLPIEPWTTNGFVLPIHGATDVPDAVKVRTYG